ncbi:hypothetical protein DFH29DRAFT_825928, partial [Suillus ampliporus]
MGATGSGKSTFINKASGSDLPVGRGLESCTSEVRNSRPFVLNGRIVTLIDTPGFDDTTRSDTDILSMIAAYFSKTYEHGARLAGVIYMHRISDFRMGGTSEHNFKIFRDFCGEGSLNNVLIVTNMWSEVKREIGEARESELASKDKFFKPVLEKGARLLRHDGSLESTHTILRYLINSHPATLRIQREIVNEHKPIEKTAAGSDLRRALDEQATSHKEEIRSLRAEMEAALRAKDEETRAELQEELEKRQQEYMRIEQSSKRMAAEFAAERARLEARILQMEDVHQKQVQTLEGGEVAGVEHPESLYTRKQRKAAKQAEDERRARKLEEEHKAQPLVEESHQKHLQSLLKTRTTKEIADVAHAEEDRRERERLAALETEQQRQNSAMEAAERERVKDELLRARREIEKVEEANSRLAGQQRLSKQREEEPPKTGGKEVARARREMEEAQAKVEREAAAAQEAQDAERARLLEEQKKQEEEDRRKMEEEQARQKEEAEKSKSQQLEDFLTKARERAILAEQARLAEAAERKKNQQQLLIIAREQENLAEQARQKAAAESA